MPGLASPNPPLTTSTASPRPSLPSELSVATTQWLFTPHDLLCTPSILAGLPPNLEHANRAKGVNFILQAGMMLKLPQITLATASVFFHRFYMRQSMIDTPSRTGQHYYSIAATSLFLASKVEENCRKMRELVIACVRVAQKDPIRFVDEQDKEYWRWRDTILHNEDLLLEGIAFDLHLEPPYKHLYDLLIHFSPTPNKKLRNAAWAFVNDSYVTTLCLRFPSLTIATSALYAAAKHCNVSFPDDEFGRPWWEIAGVDLESIKQACNVMAEVYETTPSHGRNLAGLYERAEDGDESERTRAPRQSVEGEDGEVDIGGSSPATLTPNIHQSPTNGTTAHADPPAEHPANDGRPNQETNGNAPHTPPPAAADEGLQSPILESSGEEGELET